MRRLVIAFAMLLAAPALAQPPAAESEEELVRRWEREQAIYSSRVRPPVLDILLVSTEDLAKAIAEQQALDAADTPLPPPCDPPTPRGPTQPGPPSPAPPCRPN